ncbi:trimeric intracellular cation channel type 1B.1-like isoform X1 [Portunus trituberculatus]|uniref:trimeric intracellular cation channel type 1B.1-like isoform X1 n=1 Tax=Portunus trituberculatus TaxID=210409 RepID=UPI001E1CE53A|nr:trimeric intracellular cation channel type 1B.1-like isoform X1 [Portunus trituberculatus]
MDPEAFLEMANQVTKLKMYPYFDIAHCTLCCLYVRDDLGTGSLPFSRKHPLANWLSTMLTIFAGGLLTNFLLGEPVLGALKNNQQLLLATAVWYVIFYSPFDIGYKIAKFLPIKVLLAAMKEVYRVKKINDGVTHAAKVFPNGYLSMILIGTIKGNGSGFLKIMERLMRGVWTPTAVEVMQPTFPTKASIAAAIIFVLDKKTDLISAPHALVYFGICIFFVYFKLSSLLLGIHDPFIPFENLFCAIFMGGIWDSLAQTLAGKKGAAAEKGSDAVKNVLEGRWQQ